MKLVLLAFSLVSSMAYACPNLTGNFAATLEDGTTQTVASTQSVENNVTTYTVVFNGTDTVLMVADGVKRQSEETDDSGTKFYQEETYVCNGDALVDTFFVRVTGQDGSLLFEQNGTVAVSLDSASDLLVQMETSDKDGNKESNQVTYKRQ